MVVVKNLNLYLAPTGRIYTPTSGGGMLI